MADVKIQNGSGGEQSVALAPHAVDENGDDSVQQQSRFKAVTDVFSKLRDNAGHNFKNVRAGCVGGDFVWMILMYVCVSCVGQAHVRSV